MWTAVLGLLLLLLTVAAEYIPPGPLHRCPERPQFLFPCECVSGGDAGLTVQCENSNLASLSVALTNLGSLSSPVESLTLSHCHIGRLYGSLLYPLRTRILRIEDTPIKIIDPHSFLGINRTLQELYIVRTKLQQFPTEALQVLGNLTKLYIEDHEIEVLPGNAFTGGMGLLPMRLERLRISGGRLKALPQDAFQALRKLKWLDLHGNNITELRKNQFKGLRDAELLDLSYNNIAKLDSSHLADLNKLSWCNLSHNAISDLTRGTFARNTVLRVLHMDHNRIRRLDSNSFRGMRFIRRLYFSDNQIADVGRGTFGSVTRVGTIDLARNFIKKIDYQMFNQLQYVEVIDVSENQVTEVQKLAFKDLYLVNINLSHNAIDKIESGAFENCANITMLDLSHNKIDKIPKTAFDSTTYATVLDLSYNLLTNLSQVPLHNMTGLKLLNVSFNLLETIPRNTFPKLYELQIVDLSHNKIRDIWNSVFQTLFSLRYLNLSHNSLETIKGSTFGAITTLIEMDLSSNEIKDVNRGSLARLSSIRRLSLSNNTISRIFQLPISLSHLDLSNNAIENIPPSNTWPTMNSLLSLDLANNNLQDSLERGAFINLLTLQSLNLANNGITRVPWESLSDLPTLQFLNMQDNGLSTLGKGAFGRLPVVFDLNLAYNNISNITVQAFDGMLQLLSLNLTGNKLEHIPNGAFQGLVSLRTLDLSHNFLEKLDNKTHGLLDDCLSLERVNLSHNKISFVTKKTFPSNPWVPYRLREVDLSYNVMPVLTREITYGTRKMEYLNVSHNMLNEIREGVLGNMTAVRILDLSYNQLSDLQMSQGPPPNLTELHVSNNLLATLPLKELSELKPTLRLLNVRNNRIATFNHQFMPQVENGTRFWYSGNPVVCDCLTRPLRRWLATQTKPSQDWWEMKCASPEFLAGKPFPTVPENRLNCIDGRELSGDMQFDISPDIKFRSIQPAVDKPGTEVTWYVAAREDIADFYVVVRAGEQTLLEADLPYTARRHILPSFSENAEVCVLARDSEGNVRRWRGSQCKTLKAFAASGTPLFNPWLSLIGALVGFVLLR